MAIRGRGSGRGRGRGRAGPPKSRISPPQPHIDPTQSRTAPPQPHIDPPQSHTAPPQPSHIDPPQPRTITTRISSPPPNPTSISTDASSTGGPLISGRLSASAPSSTDPLSSDPNFVPSSGGSHVESDRREVIYVPRISNLRRFVPQSVTRDIISTVVMRMPTPAERWHHYAIEMKEALFKAFMEAELKRPVSFRDVYDRVHKKKNGEYVSQRSKAIIESYDTAISEKYGEDSLTHPVVDPDVWVQVAGPNKKGRVIGGEILDIGSSHIVDQTKEGIKEVVNEAMS